MLYIILPSRQLKGRGADIRLKPIFFCPPHCCLVFSKLYAKATFVGIDFATTRTSDHSTDYTVGRPRRVLLHIYTS